MGKPALDESSSRTLTDITKTRGRSASPGARARTAALGFDKAGQQIAGARAFQEDAYLTVDLPGEPGAPGSLVLVADGMGGYAAGNVAANVAIQAFHNRFVQGYPSDDMPALLRESLLLANAAIRQAIAKTSALAGMGCTLVAAVLDADRMWWLSVGDSHLYVLRDGSLTKKNAIHTYGAYADRMAAAGTPVRDEFPRNVLSSALTGEEIPEIDLCEAPFELKAGDTLVAATDGLNSLSGGQLIEACPASEAAKDKAASLMQRVACMRHPKQDNATVVVVDARLASDVPDQPAAPPPEEHDSPTSDLEPGAQSPLDAIALRSLSPLNRLSPEALDELLACARVDPAPPGQKLFDEGDRDDSTIYLLSGEVRLECRLFETAIVQGGAEAARRPLAAQSPRQVTATVTEQAVLLHLPSSKIAGLLEAARGPDEHMESDRAGGVRLRARLSHQLFEAFLADRLPVPSLPDVAIRIRKAVDDPKAGCADVTKIVQVDPALTARLIRVANSALFRGRTKVSNCRDAVARLGLTQTRDIVTSLAMHDLFRTPSRVVYKQMLDVWTHSSRVAAIGSVLARNTRAANPDVVMLAGLVHDIGALPILVYAGAYPQLCGDPEKLAQTVAELKDQVSAMVLRKWGFPNELVNVALQADQWYRDPGERADLCDFILVAQVLSYAGTPQAASLPPLVQLPAFTKLVREHAAISSIIEQARQEMGQVMRLLS